MNDLDRTRVWVTEAEAARPVVGISLHPQPYSRTPNAIEKYLGITWRSDAEVSLLENLKGAKKKASCDQLALTYFSIHLFFVNVGRKVLRQGETSFGMFGSINTQLYR
jgi:hypothetical protein